MRRTKPEPIHEVFFATYNASRETDHRLDELRALVVRCFDGGGLGFFLGNTLGDEDTEVGRTKINMRMGLKRCEHTRIRLFAPSGVPIYASLGSASDDDVGDGEV